MAASGSLPKDGASILGGLIFSILWKCCIFGLFVAAYALVFIPREDLVETIRTDRNIQTWESFPVGFMPWGFHAGSMRVPERGEPAPLRESQEVKSSSNLVTSFQRTMGKWGRYFQKYPAYGSLVGGRLLVLAGFLVPILLGAAMAWKFGAFLNARHKNGGFEMSQERYKWWKDGSTVVLGLIFTYPFWPYPLPFAVILPFVAAWYLTIVHVRKWRA